VGILSLGYSSLRKRYAPFDCGKPALRPITGWGLSASVRRRQFRQALDKASNVYTNMLLAVQLEHSPEEGTQEGVSKFDTRISIRPRRSTRRAAGTRGVLAKLKPAETTEQDKNVKEDLDILLKAFDLQFREEDFDLQHEVPFLNASEIVFRGLRGLLDDQVAADRRPAALVRLRKYAVPKPAISRSPSC